MNMTPGQFFRESRRLILIMLLVLMISPIILAANDGGARAEGLSSAGTSRANVAARLLPTDSPIAVVEPIVSQSDYESPLGFSLEWGGDWQLDDYTALPGAEIVWLEHHTISVQVWGLMQFGGDAGACMTFLESFYGESFELSRPVAHGDIAAPVGLSRSSAFDVFSVTMPGSGPSSLYLGCQTMARDESVIGFAAVAPGATFAAGLRAADDLLNDGLSLPRRSAVRDEDRFQQTLDKIAIDVDRFYQPVLTRERERYEAPVYQGFVEPIVTACYAAEPMPGMSNAESRTLYAGQGPAYCGFDGSVYMDQAWLETYVLPNGGDIALAMIVAHEAGHHVQALTGWRQGLDYADPADEFIVEQHADCLSGAYLRSATARGVFNVRDLDGIEALLMAIGGPASGQDHGTGAERIAAFTLGFDNGTAGCGWTN